MSTAALDRAAPAPPAASGRHNEWVVAVTVTLATFMEVLDTSIANVSLPYIAGDLAASVDEAAWVLTTYLVANAIVLPTAGWISGLVGRKRFYMACVALFTVSSALCGMAPNLGTLIAFRVLQGVGGGGLQPSEQGILIDTFPAEKRGMAMAIYGMAILVAPILGPTLGGWITDNYNWRWIFYINVPVGCLSLFLTSFVVEDPPYMKAEVESHRGKPLRIDYAGLGLIALGLGALEIIYDKGQEDDWFGSRFIVALVVIAVVALTAAVIWELRHPAPIVNLRLLGDRNFGCACLMMFFTFAVLYGSTILLPQMLQLLFGYSATKAGEILSPGGLVTMAIMPVVGFLLGRKFDARWMIATGLVIMAAATYWMAHLNLLAGPWNIVEPRLLQMAGMGLIFVPINTAAYLYLPKDQSTNAAGLFNLIRNEGSSFGIALVTTLLARRSQLHQLRLGESINPYNPLTAQRLADLAAVFRRAGYDAVTAKTMAQTRLYQLVQQQAQALTYFDLFFVFAIAAIAVVPLVFLMKPSVAKEGAAAVH